MGGDKKGKGCFAMIFGFAVATTAVGLIWVPPTVKKEEDLAPPISALNAFSGVKDASWSQASNPWDKTGDYRAKVNRDLIHGGEFFDVDLTGYTGKHAFWGGLSQKERQFIIRHKMQTVINSETDQPILFIEKGTTKDPKPLKLVINDRSNPREMAAMVRPLIRKAIEAAELNNLEATGIDKENGKIVYFMRDSGSFHLHRDDLQPSEFFDQHTHQHHLDLDGIN